MTTKTKALAGAITLGFVTSTATAQIGIAPSDWESTEALRGVHVALHVEGTAENLHGVLCAHRGDGTTIAVPWGAGEPTPLSATGENTIGIDALGVTFLYRRDGDRVRHTVAKGAKARPGAHTLHPSPTRACTLPNIDTARGDTTRALNGAWRGVIPAPEGPMAELIIAAGAENTPAGLVCFANGNGSMVYWSLVDVGATNKGDGTIEWKRKKAPGGLKKDTRYTLTSTGTDQASLTIRGSSRNTIALHRGLAKRGCIAALNQR